MARLLGPLRRHWIVLIGLVGVVALIVAVDPAKVGSTIAGADLPTAAAMLPVVAALFLCHAIAWWIALRGAGALVSLRQAIGVTLISQAFDVIPGGDLWRVPIVAAGGDGSINPGSIAATVIFDDLVYFFVLTFAMVPAAITSPGLRLPLAVVLAPQLAIFAILLWPSVYSRLAATVVRIGPIRRFEPELAVLGPSFQDLVRPRVIIPVVMVDMVCAALAITLYALALSAMHAARVGPGAIAFTYATGQVLSGLTVLPGALGAYEGMMTAMMAVQGVPAAAAASAALLYRAVNDVLMGLVGLLVALSVNRRYLRGFRRPAETSAL